VVEGVPTAPPVAAQRSRRRWVVALLAVVALLTLVTAVSRTSLFTVDRVSVRGTSHLSAARVIRESGVEGRNAIWLDAGAVARTLERDPWIARAAVSRSLPSSVAIVIVERVAVAAIREPTGYRVVAADATVLGTQHTAAGLPVIRPGTIPGQAQGTYAGPARVLGALSPIVRERVASCSQDAAGDVAMRLRSGVLVRFGPATDVQAKADALSAVLAYTDAEKAPVTSIDVRFPAAPSARLGDGSSITPSA
jgi:cell division protein FtsQ